MDDNGIPATPEDRAAKLGIPAENIVIDPLAMTMGADHEAGLVALETVKLVVREFGVNITMGASNISFGLPDRKYVNVAFIAMAIQAGDKETEMVKTLPVTVLMIMINSSSLAFFLDQLDSQLPRISEYDVEI